MSIGITINVGGDIHIRNLRLSFPTFFTRKGDYDDMFGDYRETGSRSCIRKLACNSQTYHRIMKKELTLGTPAVPGNKISFATKTRELLNKELPADCQIETTQDAWYLGAICALTVTFIFPPAVLALAYCVIKAKKGGRR